MMTKTKSKTKSKLNTKRNLSKKDKTYSELDKLFLLYKLIHPGNNKNLVKIDFNKCINLVRTLYSPFNDKNLEYNEWLYMIKYLSSDLLDFKTFNIVLHLLDEKKRLSQQLQTVFAGTSLAYQYVITHNKTEATLHLYVRDILTDIDSTIINLLLHIIYLEQQRVKHNNILLCKDNESEECTKSNICTPYLIKDDIKNPECPNPNQTYKKIILHSEFPHYTLAYNSLNYLNVEEKLIYIWNLRITNLYNEINETINISEPKCKIHVIQGATKLFKYITTIYEDLDLNDVNITNECGGIYKEHDIYLSKLSAYNYRKFINENIGEDQEIHTNTQINEINNNNNIFINRKTCYKKIGLQVRIVNLENLINSINKYPQYKSKFDPIFKIFNGIDCKNTLIINISYVFGSTAFYVANAFNTVFGDKLKSFNVIGKGGGLVGKTDDYLIANKISTWGNCTSNNPYSNLPDSLKLTKSEGAISVAKDLQNINFEKLKSGKNTKIHIGEIMVMPAVAMETYVLLEYVKSKGVIGVEMECYWFKKALLNIPGLYIYYSSDMALSRDASLNHSIYPEEEGKTEFNGLMRIIMTFIKNTL
jgi:hypothetical protein